MQKRILLKIFPTALGVVFKKVAIRFAPVLVWTLATVQALLHYYYLYTIIPIDKKADWFDFAVYPLGISALLIVLWYMNKKWTLQWGIPLITLIVALFVTAFFYYHYYDTILNISLFWELLHSIDRGAIRHVLGYTGGWIIAASIGCYVCLHYRFMLHSICLSRRKKRSGDFSL